jgi:hypothetical protein
LDLGLLANNKKWVGANSFLLGFGVLSMLLSGCQAPEKPNVTIQLENAGIALGDEPGRLADGQSGRAVIVSTWVSAGGQRLTAREVTVQYRPQGSEAWTKLGTETLTADAGDGLPGTRIGNESLLSTEYRAVSPGAQDSEIVVRAMTAQGMDTPACGRAGLGSPAVGRRPRLKRHLKAEGIDSE